VCLICREDKSTEFNATVWQTPIRGGDAADYASFYGISLVDSFDAIHHNDNEERHLS
jgi:hypothetical protein